MTESSLSIYLGNSFPSGEQQGPSVLQFPTLGAVQYENALTLSALNIYVDAAELSAVWDAPMNLSSFSKYLQSDAVVSVHVLSSESSTDLQPIHTAFLLAGLLASGEQVDVATRVLSAKKRPQEHQERMQAAALPKKAVELQLDDDLIDEDSLLKDTSNLLAPPPAMSQAAAKGGDDCAGRKPCDDCTCGRADEEKKVEEKPAVKKSSCGKCGLGDAFRCPTCPYLGKPAFKPGEEHLVLDLQDDI